MVRHFLLFASIIIAALFVSSASANSKSLTVEQYANAAALLGVRELAVLKAIDSVESGGSGFLKSGKPKILFERHHFRKYTNGRYDRSYSQISNASPGGYYGGEREYTRFNQAARLDESAAIKSTSWGRFQILGSWHKVCGYSTPQAYRSAMQISEAYHLDCLVKFIKHQPHLITALNKHDWAKFAYSYNGAYYYRHHYDRKIATAYAQAVRDGWNKHAIPAHPHPIGLTTRPATRPPTHPATRPPTHPPTRPPTHPSTTTRHPTTHPASTRPVTTHPSTVVPTATVQTTTQTAAPALIGCFIDTAVRDLTLLAFDSEELTIKICSDTCSHLGHRYSGVQNGTLCFCDDNYGSFGRADNVTECNVPCAGDNSTLCGGEWRNAIYMAAHVDPEDDDIIVSHEEGDDDDVIRSSAEDPSSDGHSHASPGIVALIVILSAVGAVALIVVIAVIVIKRRSSTAAEPVLLNIPPSGEPLHPLEAPYALA